MIPRLDRCRVEAFTRAGNGVRVDIGGEYLELDVSPRGGDLFTEKHGKRISLFARAAAGYPDTQRLIGRIVADQFWNDLLREKIEDLLIAKEAGDIDEEIFDEAIQLGCVAAQGLEVAIHFIGLDRRHRHAPFDPASECA